MVHKFLKGYLFVAILFSDFLMFADDNPGTDMEDETGSTDNSVEEAPINGWMVYMLILGIAFAFYYFKKRKQQQSV